MKALVTGASSGIGLALSRRLVARGVEVWMAARRIEVLEREVEAIRAGGGRAHAVVLDIADVDGTAERLARLDEEVGGIDLVVANAGMAGKVGGVRLKDARWEDVKGLLHTNLVGSAATMFPFIGPMVQRGRGHFVAVSSLAADLPIGRTAAYGASKAGLTYFLEAMDIELGALGIDVTIVHPGFVKTAATDEMAGEVPMPLMVPVERAAKIIDRAIQRRARLVRFPWISGAMARLTYWLPRVVMRPLIRWLSG